MTRQKSMPQPTADFLPEPGAERANRMVPLDVRDHYLRQGEHIAEALVAVSDLMRAAAARLRAGTAGVHRPSTRLR